MEKQRKDRKYKLSTRFLIYLFCGIFTFLSASPVFSQRLTYSIIKELTVKTVNENNFSGTDCAFELKIPYVKSDVVQAQIPDLPSGVNFVSLRRSEYSDTESGTKIELWLNFAQAGNYNLRYLKVFINNKPYNLPFEVVKISDNPRNMLPQLVISFDNGVELISQYRGKQLSKAAFSTVAGKKLNFTVSLQYAVQIISYNWSVPKNALFAETERYDITKGTLRSSEFSEEMIPVASFEWEPLYSGNLYLPDLKIIATSYNGTRVELSLPEAFIYVVDDPKSGTRKSTYENVFAYAFTKKALPQKKNIKNTVTPADCRQIAEFRSMERNAIPFTSAYRQRKDYEEKLGVNEASPEPTKYSLWIGLGVLVICLIVLLIFIVLKKLSGILSFSATILLVSVFCIIQSVRLSQTYAIYVSGNISPVPEESVEAVISMESGKRVKIEQKAGGWVYVEYGSTGGWAKEENVEFIKK